MRRCYGCFDEIRDDLEVCPLCGYIKDTLPETSVHLKPGSVLSERYIIGRVLGYGDYGVTYIGWDAKLEQKVAIKEYLPCEFSTRVSGQNKASVISGSGGEQFIAGLNRFIDKAKKLSQFQKEDGIVRVFDCIAENDTAYIIMEYLDGESVSDRLKRESIIPDRESISLLKPVINALSEIHDSGMIHGNISPDNIVITTDGRVKLIGFGDTHPSSVTQNSISSSIIPGYSAPEQYVGGTQGPYTDVYSLGATMYKMLTGTTPPEASERQAYIGRKKRDPLVGLRKIKPTISPVTEAAVLNALNLHAEDRTPTAQDFIQDLTSEDPVIRKQGQAKKIIIYGLPLWIKILVPSLLTIIIVVGVLLATGVISFSSVYKTGITVPEGYTTVPNVEGLDVSSAASILNDSDLDYISGGNVLSDYVDADLIVLQDPESGKTVAQGTTIVLTVSRGNGVIVLPENGLSTVPVFLWSEEADALKDFETAGINTIVEYRPSDNVTPGQVIMVLDSNGDEINSGDTLPQGTTVTVVVSKGPDASGPSETTVAPSEETAIITSESSSQYPNDRFGLVVNNSFISVGESFDDMRDAFEDEMDVSEGPDGNNYHTSDWSIYVLTDSDDKASYIATYDPYIMLPEGVRCGDHRADVLEALGDPDYVRGTLYILESGESVEYTYEDYLHGDVIGGKTFGDIIDYEYIYIRGETVLYVCWTLPDSYDPDAIVCELDLITKDDFNSYDINDIDYVYTP